MDKVLDIQFDMRTGALNVTGALPRDGRLTADQLGALRQQIMGEVDQMPADEREPVRAAAEDVIRNIQTHGVHGVSYATCADGIKRASQMLAPIQKATLGLAMTAGTAQRTYELGQVNSLISAARALLNGALDTLQDTAVQRMNDKPAPADEAVKA